MSKQSQKHLTIATVLVTVGVISLIMENYHYQYLDEQGVLHESLFLPLGMCSLITGAVLGLFGCFKLIKKINKEDNETSD